MDENARLILTEKGRAIAEKIYDRHILFTRFFIQLGVDEQVAAVDACRMEHTLSDETFAALKEFIETHLT